MLIISLVAAVSENGVIGNQNTLPWYLPEELKYFRSITQGKPVIMGRKTFESIGSKPLSHRRNIILTRDTHFSAPGCTVVRSVDEAVQSAGKCDEIMIIGGAEIFRAFLPLATRIYLTVIHDSYEGDTYFPEVDWKAWQIKAEQKRDGFTTKIFDKGS